MFITGFLMNVLNPLIIAFWLTTSTSFASDSINDRFFIFAIALALVLVGDVLKVILANKIRKRLTLRNIQMISKLNGVILIFFGLVLLWGILFYNDNFSL